MMRFLLSMLVVAVGVNAQSLSRSPETVTNLVELAGRTPRLGATVILADTNTSRLLIWTPGARTPTNATTLIAPVNAAYVGRWIEGPIGGAAGGALLAANNLSEIASPSTALANIGGLSTNLGISYRQELILPKRLGTIVYAQPSCVADGVTDDRTALNALIAALAAGETLDLEDKTYAISDTLTVTKNNITIRGNGASLKVTSTNMPAVSIAGTNVVWDNVDINQNLKAGGGILINATSADVWVINSHLRADASTTWTTPRRF